MAKTDTSIPPRKEIYLEAYAETREVIEREGFTPVLMKSDGQFPYLHSNMDILVVNQGKGRCPEEALDSLAIKIANEKGYHYLTHYREPMKRLLRKRSEPDDKIVHLHGWVGWGSEEFIGVVDFTAEMREGRDRENFFYPSPKNIILLTISHAIYENSTVADMDVEKVMAAVNEIGDGLTVKLAESLLKTARKYGWQNGLALFFVLMKKFWDSADGDFAELLLRATGVNRHLVEFVARYTEKKREKVVINRYATKLLFFDKIFSTGKPISSQILSACLTLSRHMLPRLGLSRQRPFVIAFSGMDGSGKSFYSENLLKEFESFDLKTDLIWVRGGNTDLFVKMKSALRKLLEPFAGKSSIVRTYEKDEKVGNQILINLWSVAVFLNLLYHYALLIRIKKWMRRVVVSDRFVDDTFIDLMRRADGGGRFIEALYRLAKLLSPTPDRQIFLKVTAEEAAKRKKQSFPLESLKERERIYEDILGEISHIVIDTDKVKKEKGINYLLNGVLAGYFRDIG